MLESQNKLEELMPIAQQALKVQGGEVDGEIQLTALSLFHKILIQAAGEESSNAQKEKALAYLRDFIPSVCQMLSARNAGTSSQVLVKVECLHTIAEIIEKFPAAELFKYSK